MKMKPPATIQHRGCSQFIRHGREPCGYRKKSRRDSRRLLFMTDTPVRS
jgi:hypothetical protein